MSNTTVENVYTRQFAKEMARKHFWKLLGMMLIVGLIVYGLTFAGLLLTGVSVSSTTTLSSSPSLTSYVEPSAPLNAGGLLIYEVIMIAVSLLGGALGMGMTSATIDLCRGDETVTVGRVFSRMGLWLKAFGLALWVGLKTLAWMLPGLAMMFLLAFVGATAESEALLAVGPFLAMILMFALVIPAAYRYMLSTYVMADEPTRGIRESVEMSKRMMAGHKWQMFRLVIPVILVTYAVILGVALVAGLLTAALSEASAVIAGVLMVLLMIAMIVLALYFAIRMMMCYAKFYLNRRAEIDPPAEEAAPEADPTV